MLFTSLALSVLASAAAVRAAATVNLTSAGCIDAAGFETCQNTATATASVCIANANENDSELELVACGCELYVDNYNCYSSHCWNRVYECEYQGYIAEYMQLCPTAKLPVPYFPAPDGAPDACSCNLGNVFVAFNNSITQGAACSTRPNVVTDIGAFQGCDCCELSGAISSIYGICPDTDPTLIGLSNFNTLESLLDTPFGSCGPYLSKYNCVSDLGFTSLASGASYYASTALPTSGTATLSNIGGTVTAPGSGAVFTYTNGADNQVYTITAASVNAAAPTGSSTGGSQPGGSTATSTGGAANPSPTKDGAVGLGVNAAVVGAGSLLAACWVW